MGKITNVLLDSRLRSRHAVGRELSQSGLAFSDVLLSMRHCYRDSHRKKKGKGLGPITIMGNPSKSSFKLKVLYGESDEEVLASQAVSIQKAGHEVATAVGRKGVEETLRRQQSFDLVILGPTLTRNDRHHLPYMVKKAHPGTRVLVMHADGGRHPQVDANIDTGRSIDDLLEKIAEMLAQEVMPGKS